jgi:hypothetical protein
MSTGDGEGPAWNKFWMSMGDDETGSMMSGEGSSHHPYTPDARSLMSPDHGRPGMMDRLDSVLPNDSASHAGVPDSPDQSTFAGATEDTPFTFKFKAPGGRVHRLQVVASAGMSELVSVVSEKLGGEAEGLGGVPTFEEGKLSKAGFALAYMDNEGDIVSITTDGDLLEAITIARQSHQDKVDLFVHHPERAAVPPTTEPQPLPSRPLTPPESHIRRRRFEEEEEDDDSPSVRSKDRKSSAAAKNQEQTAQVIPGVPNELLLPGAIAVLAGVIVITFAVGRASSR